MPKIPRRPYDFNDAPRLDNVEILHHETPAERDEFELGIRGVHLGEIRSAVDEITDPESRVAITLIVDQIEALAISLARSGALKVRT